MPCPVCGAADQPIHNRQARRWQHLHFFQYRAWIEAEVPRVACSQCGKTRQVEVPWARTGSRFSLVMEAFVVALCQAMPVAHVMRLVGVSDDRIWRVLKHHVTAARRQERYDAVRRVGVDETSTRRGRRPALGLAASRESPTASVNGPGSVNVPAARFRTTPETGLASFYLVDSGTLAHVAAVDHQGFEGLWIHRTRSPQGEYLKARTRFDDNRPAYAIHGAYAFASWIATGESRPYGNGNVGNAQPSRLFGALEFALRYSTLDLNGGSIQGGREYDWTLGANWYLGRHLKFQANYVRAFSDRKGLGIDPRTVELRAQVLF